MNNGISGVGTSPVATPPTDIQESSSPGTTGTGPQVEQTLGSAPRTPVTANTSARQTVSTSPLSSLRGTTTRGVRTTPQRTQRAQSKARAGLPKQIGITVPPASRAVGLDSRMIAKEIQSLPKSQRAGATASAGKKLQQRVNNGFKVYEQIQAGNAKTPASTTDVRDFMTFLTAKAGQKTASFSQGAFNLPDPGHKIRNFLDSSAEVYQRSSTHIKGFSDQPGCGHRGIDLKLPHGMGTLLYGGMGHNVQDTKGDRIFLKMESHGCRISTLSDAKVDKQGPQSRPKRFLSDLLTSIKHGWGGLLTKLHLQKTDGTRKERVDKGVVKDFKALVKMAKDSGVPGLKSLLNKHNPTHEETGHGVRTMMTNIDALLDIKNIPPKAKERLGLGDLPPNLKTALEAFKSQMESRYDHLEHRIGNEIVFDKDELIGAGDAKDKMRDGQARSLVSQLTTIKNADAVTPNDIKGLLSTMYALGSTIDGEGKDDRADQKDSALSKAITGLSTEQKAHLNEILTSDKIQDLANEFLDRSMGAEFDLPGHSLNHQQELNVRGLMADAMETLTFMTQEVGGQPRLDGEYSQSQVENLTDTLFNITDSLSGAKSQEQIQEYLSEVDIKDRSALQLQTLAGKDNMVVGTSAKAMFPKGLPQVDSRQITANAREDVERGLTDTMDLETEGLAGEIGITKLFMKDFKRNGVEVNGEHFGAPAANMEQELQRFVDAIGGPTKAMNVSRFLHQDGVNISMAHYFLDTGETGQDLLSGQAKVGLQGNDVASGGTRSITIEDDGSAVIRLTKNTGSQDQVSLNFEAGIKLSSLNMDLQVSDVQVAMLFISND